MRIRVPSHVLSLEPYAPGKPVEELERELGISGSIKLASNENPLGPSPLAIRAARQALSGAHRYPDGGGFYLKRKLSERLGIPSDSIVLGNGSTELVELLAKAFIGPADNAVVSEGAFIMYRIAVASVGGACHLAPMTRDLRHDLDAMGARIDAQTRLV